VRHTSARFVKSHMTFKKSYDFLRCSVSSIAHFWPKSAKKCTFCTLFATSVAIYVAGSNQKYAQKYLHFVYLVQLALIPGVSVQGAEIPGNSANCVFAHKIYFVCKALCTTFWPKVQKSDKKDHFLRAKTLYAKVMHTLCAHVYTKCIKSALRAQINCGEFLKIHHAWIFPFSTF